MNSKAQIRKRIKRLHKKLTNKNAKSKKINQRILLQIKKGNYKNVFSFIPLKNEPNISPINSYLIRNNYQLYIPIFIQNTWKLCELRSRKIYKDCTEASISKNQLVLIPGLAFTKDGKRLGHGQGIYDRFLENCNANKIAICFEYQIVKNIPQDPHDIKVDSILTESNFY